MEGLAGKHGQYANDVHGYHIPPKSCESVVQEDYTAQRGKGIHLSESLDWRSIVVEDILPSTCVRSIVDTSHRENRECCGLG